MAESIHPVNSETLYLSLLKNGEVKKTLKILTTEIIADKIESGDEETILRFLSEEDKQDINEITVNVIRMPKSVASDSSGHTSTVTMPKSVARNPPGHTSTVTMPQSVASNHPRHTTPLVTKTSIWTKDSEKYLLSVFDKYEKQKGLVKNKWIVISEEMKKSCFKLEATPEQCRAKVRALREKYDRLKKKLNTSGEDNTQIPDELKVFEGQPDATPKYIIDSATLKTGSSENENTTDDEMSDHGDSDNQPRQSRKRKECPKALEGKGKKKRKTTSSLDKLDQMAENSERRHQERMKCFQSLVDVMKEIAKK